MYEQQSSQEEKCCICLATLDTPGLGCQRLLAPSWSLQPLVMDMLTSHGMLCLGRLIFIRWAEGFIREFHFAVSFTGISLALKGICAENNNKNHTISRQALHPSISPYSTMCTVRYCSTVLYVMCCPLLYCAVL